MSKARKLRIGVILASVIVWFLLVGTSSLIAQEASSVEQTAEKEVSEKSDTAVKLGEIVVTATKTDVAGKQIIGNESAAAESMSKTVEGLLEGFSGVDLSRCAFSGNQSSRLSIRGFDESRSLIMMDGRPLHGAGVYGGADHSRWPRHLFRR